MAHEILTPRLKLRLMSEEFLEASLKKEIAKAEELIGLKVSFEWLQEKDLIALRLNDCRSDANYLPWSLRAISLKSSNTIIGHIGFHSCPNADYLRRFVPEGIEFGYTLFPKYRRQGFAQEAIHGLLNWAMEQQTFHRFIVSIAPTNRASIKLSQKIGFVKIGEHEDEVDGVEEIYQLAGEALRKFLE